MRIVAAMPTTLDLAVVQPSGNQLTARRVGAIGGELPVAVPFLAVGVREIIGMA